MTKLFDTKILDPIEKSPEEIAALKKVNAIKAVGNFRAVLEYLYDGEKQTIAPLLFIQANYKQWGEIYLWLKKNEIKGKKLLEFFQNESPDGGGFHMGVTHILSRIKGKKNEIVGIKGDELRKL